MRLEPLISHTGILMTFADEAVSVVSGGYINGRNSANLELLIDKTSSIYLYVKFKKVKHATPRNK
jgi:hypothetical protein